MTRTTDLAEANEQPSGRNAFVGFIIASPLRSARFEMKRVIADAEHVVAHYRLVTPDDSPDLAAVDVWRIVDGLITEHWDVVQPVPADAEVPNGMF